MELSSKRPIKFYFTLCMVYHQSKDPSIVTEPPVSFRSEVFTALNMENVDLHCKIAMEQFQKQVDEFQKNGSGWVLDHFINLDIGKHYS